MRAQEFVTERKKSREDFEGMTIEMVENGHVLVINALDDWGNNVLGSVAFNIHDNNELDPQDLKVDERYQGQGIAKAMYDYAKSKGYKIYRSYDQTDAGAGFWNKHRGKDVRVWESFDQPYAIDWEDSEYGDIDALATLDDGTHLSIMFNQESGHDGRSPSHWSVEFYRNNSQEVTGEGDAQKVFATVLAAIQQFIKRKNPGSISFSASKEPEADMAQPGANVNPESRAKLYNRLVQRYASSMGYSVQQQEGNSRVTYTLRPATQGVAEGESNDTAISLSKLGKFHPGADTLAEFVPERASARYALHPDKWESTFYSLTNKDSDKLKYYGPKKISIPPGTLVGDMAIANKFYRAKTPEEKQQYAELYQQSLKPYPIDVSQYRMPELLIPQQTVEEQQLDELNFLGSECTKDCSGHRAGYEWSKRKGLRQANSWSPSFNKGAGLAVAGK